MRFTPHRRHPFNDTPRKRSFIAIRKRREREKFPLFAELIAETQTESVDEEMARRAVRWAEAEQSGRDERAFHWRRVRARLRAYDADDRAALLTYWNRCSYPGEPIALATLMHRFEEGDYAIFDGELISLGELGHRQQRDERIRAMSDEELLRQIQTHFSDKYRDLLRAERERRWADAQQAAA